MNIAQKIPLIGFSLCVLLGGSVAGAAEVVTQRAEAKLRSECVSPEAYKIADACPKGPKKFGGKVRHKTAFKTAPPPRERKERKDDLAPKNASESMAAGQRDARKTRLQARSRALLITEIQGLERLYKQTPQKSKDRPQLVRRLAEGYVELESAANRDMIESQIKAQDAKQKRQRKTYDASRREAA